MNPPDFRELAASAETPKELFSASLAYSYHLSEATMPEVLAAFAGVSDFVFSDKVDTAAISFDGSSFAMCVNRNFTLKYAPDPENFLFVVCHELMHKTSGDLLGAPSSRAEQLCDNVAADLIINDYLARYVFPSPPAILKKLYARSPLPFRLLAHHSAISEEELVDGETNPEAGELAIKIFRIIRDGLAVSRASIKDYVARLFFLKYGYQPDVTETKVILLGGHGANDDKALSDLLKRILGRDLSVGSGFGYEQYDEKAAVNPDKSALLREIITKALEPDVKNPVVKEMLTPEYGVMPAFSRRDAFFLASGFMPVFYRNLLEHRDVDESRVHVYFDVSESTRYWWPVIYAILAGAKDLVGSPVYAFSNTVVPITMKDVEKGALTTTGGTDIECVAGHARKKGFRRILIITDGEIGPVSARARSIISSLDTYAIIKRFSCSQEFIKVLGGPGALNRKFWLLPAYFGVDETGDY